MASNNYLDRMEKYRYVKPLNHLPDVPLPEGISGIKVLLQMPSTFLNVRGGPGVTYRTLGQIYAVSAKDVMVFPGSEKNGWVFVSKGELSGWISTQGGKVSWKEEPASQDRYPVYLTISLELLLTQEQIETFDPEKVTVSLKGK